MPIINECGYSANMEKIAVIPRSGQQRVTGLVVNSGTPKFPRTRRRFLRQEVHHLVRHGVEEHVHRRRFEGLNYRDWLYGHLCALGMAHPAEAAQLMRALEVVSWPS